jgi:peptidyl-dipeptidase Dcp
VAISTRESAVDADLSPENPFFEPSALPFAAPPFDRIRDDDYLPAIDAGMRQHLAEVERIAGQREAPTFENTLVAIERSGQLLTRALKTLGVVAGANTNDTLQAVQRDLAPRLAAHSDAILLNDRLFARVRDLYDRRALLTLTPEQRRLVERYHLDFVRAGARLSEADKSRLRALNQEESTLSNEFQTRLLAATRAGAIAIQDRAELDGLSDSDIAAAAATAAERGTAGWVLPLHNTTQQPAQDSLRRRDVRQRLFEASVNRAMQNDANDTRAIIQRLAQLRAEHAALLGYPNAAAYVLDDQMAKTPEAAITLLADVAGPASEKVRAEAAQMRAIMQRELGDVPLEPWDWHFYAEQVRRAEYDLDETEIKPYFELERVLRDGVFFAAQQLFGIAFVEREDIPVYHPDVRVFEVLESTGEPLALFMCDYFKRDNKNGGAWMDNLVDQSRLLGSQPVIVNVANLTKPAAGQPALLSFDDVTMLFHEFGHALHGMFSDVEFPVLSGTNVPRDFVEFPSQFNEHWALEPMVFANYARHHRTGAPMPRALVDRIRASRTFNQGFALTEYISAAAIDMAWHTLQPGAPQQDVREFETSALERHAIAMREVPPRYWSTYFAHIWEGGYNASYYAYLWAEVLDHDAYAWFTENGGLTRANGQRLRDMILSRGATEDGAVLYREFRGRDPQPEPLLLERGLVSAPIL